MGQRGEIDPLRDWQEFIDPHRFQRRQGVDLGGLVKKLFRPDVRVDLFGDMADNPAKIPRGPLPSSHLVRAVAYWRNLRARR